MAEIDGVAGVDAREVADDVADVLASHAALIGHLRSLDPIDPASPSLLPDWTIGHVLTHIARNADSMLAVLSGRPQYAHGRDGRNADIEAGATRRWSDLVDDVELTSAAVDKAFEACDDWTGTVAMLPGERPKSQVPLLRQREVEVHRADLGLGHTFADMPARYLRKELRFMEMLWRASRPMGMTQLPDAALALPPATRLAWMMGRARVDGLPPAKLF